MKQRGQNPSSRFQSCLSHGGELGNRPRERLLDGTFRWAPPGQQHDLLASTPEMQRQGESFPENRKMLRVEHYRQKLDPTVGKHEI